MVQIWSVLVTGASSGIGRAIALALQLDGHQVFGTSRKPSTQETVRDYTLLELEVGSEASIKACVAEFASRATHPLALVNNAGIGVFGAAEETSMDAARHQLDVNFFGPVRLIKEILPHMRKAGRGRIVQIASLAGLVGTPYQAFYSASKHALEGYSKSLRMELRSFGIDVSLVEPGFFKSGIAGAMEAPKDPISDYDRVRSGVQSALTIAVESGPSPKPVAVAVGRLLRARRPRVHTIVGRDAKPVALLRFLFPGLLEWGTRRRFGIS